MRSANFWFLSATLQRAIQSGVLKMADSSTRDAVIRRELGVPPTFDLVRHARNLARVFFPALVIALLVGGIVYAVRGSATPVYQSDIVAEVQSASQIVVTDANLGQLVAPYVALATDSDVVAAIHDQLNNGWTTADVSSHISVTPGTSPALVFVKATAFSQADADRAGTNSRRHLERRAGATQCRHAGSSYPSSHRRHRSIERGLGRSAARKLGRIRDARRRSDYQGGSRREAGAVAPVEIDRIRFRPTAVAFRPRGTGLPVAPKPLVGVGGCVLGGPSFSLPKSSLPAGVDSVRE